MIGEIFSIIGLICGFCVIILGLVREKTSDVMGGIFLVVFNVFTMYMGNKLGDKSNEPTALDVYRGKTTLQITYNDSIPVDSVVIFKK